MLGRIAITQISAYELIVSEEEREPLENILNQLYPLMLTIAQQALPLAISYPIPAGSEPIHNMATRMIKICLSCWESSMLVSLPNYFIEANLSITVNMLIQLLEAPLPSGLNQSSQAQDFRIISLLKNSLRIAAK
jgi:hypothetical protein